MYTKRKQNLYNDVLLIFLFITSMTIAFLQNANVFTFNYLQQYLIALFWIFLGIYKVFLNRGIKGNYAKSIKFYLQMFLIPCILYWVYTFFLYFIGQGNRQFFLTSIINLSMMTITILCAFSCLYIFKEKLLKYIVSTIVLSMIIVIINAIVLNGPFVLFTTLYEILVYGESENNPFEVGDITFAAGLLLLYYTFFKKGTKKVIKYLIISWFIVIIGFKRIQILSLIPVIGFGFGLRIWNKNTKKICIVISSVILIFVTYFFIYSVQSGLLSNYVWGHGINTMGRMKMYEFMANYFQFDASYLGHGYAYTLRMLHDNGFEYVLHSDILRFYVEFGFILFGLWQWYFLMYLPKKIEKNFSFENSIIFYLMTFYLFLLYFTDNTFSYFITQFMYMVIITTLCANQITDEKLS